MGTLLHSVPTPLVSLSVLIIAIKVVNKVFLSSSIVQFNILQLYGDVFGFRPI